MNRIRLDFASEIQEKASKEYNDTKSKRQKLQDKKDLDERIQKARGPLLQILKLTKDDLHYLDQIQITKVLSLKNSNAKNAFLRKTKVSEAKKRILEAYRLDPSLDIKKYAQENQVLS
jgi:hypothetical protein